MPEDSVMWNLYLVEPTSSFFGHFSHRSEWQLIKIDYKGLFSRRCMDGDYQTWHLHNKVTRMLRTFFLLVYCYWKQRELAECLNKGFLAFSLFANICQLWKTTSSFSLFDRESRASWVRNRSIWSAGRATVACWHRTTPGSILQSPASVQLMILNGNDFTLFPYGT